MTPNPLEAKVLRQLARAGIGDRPRRVLVALSGGCDSVVLLYLLRFPFARLGLEPVAAHLDHRMRDSAAGDAQWVHGLCTAWQVPLISERLPVAPVSEDDAREARYAFLRRAAAAASADLIATGHHADDQAETVLFRVLRGTGLRGLAGIAPLADGILRPLLPLWREEIEAYARARRLVWRTDETNLEAGPVRNRLRHEIIPLLEERIAPGARRSLVSLAQIAAEAEKALERIAAEAAGQLVKWDGNEPSLARDRLHLYDSAITSRVLRNLLRHFGVVLDRTGTRRALQFINDAQSGRRMPLSSRLCIEIEFDRAHFREVEVPPPDLECQIDRAGKMTEAPLRIGGKVYRVIHGVATPERLEVGAGDRWVFYADPRALSFPMRLRGWRSGDRLRVDGRRRSLKKVFLEQRVPRARRAQLPLLVDMTGDVLWVGGLSPTAQPLPERGESFVVKVLHD